MVNHPDITDFKNVEMSCCSGIFKKCSDVNSRPVKWSKIIQEKFVVSNPNYTLFKY